MRGTSHWHTFGAAALAMTVLAMGAAVAQTRDPAVARGTAAGSPTTTDPERAAAAASRATAAARGPASGSGSAASGSSGQQTITVTLEPWVGSPYPCLPDSVGVTDNAVVLRCREVNELGSDRVQEFRAPLDSKPATLWLEIALRAKSAEERLSVEFDEDRRRVGANCDPAACRNLTGLHWDDGALGREP